MDVQPEYLQKEDDTNVTKDFLNAKADFESLFEFLNNRKEVDQKRC